MAGAPTGRFQLTHLPETDSTSAHLKRALAEGAGAWTAVTATRQTAGYGQRGRVWASPAAGGLYLSAAVPLPAAPTLLPLAVGLAVAEALAPWTAEVGLKWVNDLVARGRKLGGVLVEASRGVAVVGVGVNLHTPDVEAAIGLAELTAAPPSAAELAPAVLASLAATLTRWEASGDEAVLGGWRQRAVTLGQPVVVDGLAGEALDVGPAGELMLRLADGTLRAVVSGTVRHADGSYCGPAR